MHENTSPADSTRALLTERTVTWREASEGWAVLTVASAAAVGVALLVRLTRLALARRG